MAVTVEGHRDILGIWAGDGGEGAKHWLAVLTELKNRGVDDVLMLVCDGLKGLPQAVETVRTRRAARSARRAYTPVRPQRRKPPWTHRIRLLGSLSSPPWRRLRLRDGYADALPSC
ncbi:hypothetical protein GCM10009734_82390 [Nonomuraea bangladeshensis]